jgi:hypothetical protein
MLVTFSGDSIYAGSFSLYTFDALKVDRHEIDEDKELHIIEEGKARCSGYCPLGYTLGAMVA